MNINIAGGGTAGVFGIRGNPDEGSNFRVSNVTYDSNAIFVQNPKNFLAILRGYPFSKISNVSFRNNVWAGTPTLTGIGYWAYDQVGSWSVDNDDIRIASEIRSQATCEKPIMTRVRLKSR